MNQKVWITVLNIIGAVAFVVAGYAAGTAEEDDLAWNCYLKGNHECGNSQPTTGFVNLEIWN